MIVLGNGGIMTAEDAVGILKNYPLLDGLGIARGAWGKPFIFDEIKQLLRHCERSEAISRLPRSSRRRDSLAMTNYDLPKIKKIMIRHAELIFKDKGKRGIFEIRKHMCWYIKGFPGAAELRRKLVIAENLKEIKAILKCA